MNETPKTKLGWRLLRWGLIGLAVLVTLGAVLVTEENWRTKRAWDNYKREAETRGERFDLSSVVPEPVPDEQNFYSAPIVAEALKWSQKNSDEEPQSPNEVTNRMNFKIYRGDSGSWPTNGGDWQKGKLTDLKEWQTYFRNFAETPERKTNGFPFAPQPQTPAADILLALSCFDPAVKELREALQRPYARLPLKYDDGFDAVGELTHYLANVKRCGQLFSLRIHAELDNRQSEQALDDVKLLLGVTDSIRDQPFLISHLVRIAMMAITLQPVYEGLAQQRWSDAQLTELEKTLAKQDFLADFQFAMRGEKIMAIQSVERQGITREMKSVYDSAGTDKIVTTSLRCAPSAFFYGTKLAFAQMHEQFIVPLIDLTNRVVAPAALREAQAAVQSQMKHYSYYKVQAQMVFPAIASSVNRFAKIQSQVDLARVACALERFRLAHGNYPDALDVIAPQFIPQLPHDLINGQPLHYRRKENGQFILYSIGWDEKDDGGKIFLTKKGAVDPKKGDWVWQYPQN